MKEYYKKHEPKQKMTVPEFMTLNLVRILNIPTSLKNFPKNNCILQFIKSIYFITIRSRKKTIFSRHHQIIKKANSNTYLY